MVKSISDEPLPVRWQVCIRNAIERHSSDSHAFNGKEDLFYSVEGLGSGHWGLRNYKNNNK